MRRGLVRPLFQQEPEPGQAVHLALQAIHPFTVDPEVPLPLLSNIDKVCSSPREVVARRRALLQLWGARAIELAPASLAAIRGLSDPYLRRLLLGTCDAAPGPQLGQFAHIALWQQLAQAANALDQGYVQEFLHGLPIVGDVARSGRWPELSPKQPEVTVRAIRTRAWEIRARVLSRVAATPLTDHSVAIWDDTLQDVQEGSTVGPFFHHEEVSEFLGDQFWVPTQRFEVVQKNKVRGVDSATINFVNQATVVTEKLCLPSTDLNVAVIRALRKRAGAQRLASWVLDEKKAYRQIPVLPEHRSYSIIALREPSSGRVALFVMIGHSFGLVAAVYNFNRRAALLDQILINVFGLVSFCF